MFKVCIHHFTCSYDRGHEKIRGIWLSYSSHEHNKGSKGRYFSRLPKYWKTIGCWFTSTLIHKAKYGKNESVSGTDWLCRGDWTRDYASQW